MSNEWGNRNFSCPKLWITKILNVLDKGYRSNFDGKEEFLVDGGVFPGSSGSPVFIFNQGSFSAPNGIVLGNRLLFVGIISKTLSHVNQSEKDYLNLGKVINGRAIIREIELFVDKIKQQ